MNAHRSKMTVVFEVADEAALEPFYAAFRDKTPVHGMIPRAMQWGDAVTIPDEVVEGLANDIDPAHPDKRLLAELVQLAEDYQRRPSNDV